MPVAYIQQKLTQLTLPGFLVIAIPNLISSEVVVGVGEDYFL